MNATSCGKIYLVGNPTKYILPQKPIKCNKNWLKHAILLAFSAPSTSVFTFKFPLVGNPQENKVDGALFDEQRKGRPIEITDDAIAWIINIACQRPADLGYSQELWTLKNLNQHIQKNAIEAGFPRLTTITKSMLQKLLKKSDIKPFKIKYYCEKRDPNFETKMHDILLVYKQISLQFDESGTLIIPENVPMVHTVSCDEKL